MSWAEAFAFVGFFASAASIVWAIVWRSKKQEDALIELTKRPGVHWEITYGDEGKVKSNDRGSK